ncbi:ADP-ribosylation factor-like protein 6 isoform X1 [Daphnia magna]|uniref:ADP-ribosylation factor-like protein 6 isoform X1 n=1 Tax=Daphnia magna TaxID=35525 RepID=UPI0014024679|nr:ADP-ribosylation factor-like protein 6 isoform X1 [Daphnia magna]
MKFWDSFLTWLKIKKKQANVLIVGLDNSGKSTVVQHLQSRGKRSEVTVPTIGFNVEKFQNAGLTLTAFDMSGQSKYRPLWERYYNDCHGVIFVIDSSDTMRMAVACNELQLMIQHPEMVKNRSTTLGVPILILANKSDLDSAIPIGQIRAELRLDDIETHPIHLEASNALTGVGLHAGLQWLSEQIIKSNF